MKNHLLLYLAISLVACGIYPVTVWGKVYEVQSSIKREKEIRLVKQAANRKTRSILVPPCSVFLSDASLTFSFHSLSEDAEIILYNSDSEVLRIPISKYQRGSDMNIPVGCLEAGSYTLEVVTASGERWCGMFEYVL